MDLFSSRSKKSDAELAAARSEPSSDSSLAMGRRAVENRNSSSSSTAANNSIPGPYSEQVRLGRADVASWYNSPSPDKLSSAQQHFRRALSEHRDDADAHHGMAIVADLQEDYKTAEQHYLEAVALRPTDARILGDLGYSYLLQNRVKESELYLSRALAHEPNNQNAIKHLGDVYARTGKLDLARSTYRRVLNESEVTQAIAENSKTESDQSLLDRLRNRPNADSELIGDLQRGFDERHRLEEQQRQQRLLEQRDPRRQMTGEQLRDQLANIDGERYRDVSEGPIIIGGPGEPIQRLPQGNMAPEWPTQTPAFQTEISPRGQASSQTNQPSAAAPFPREMQAATNNQQGELVDELNTPWGRPVQPANGFSNEGGVGTADYAQPAPGPTSNAYPNRQPQNAIPAGGAFPPAPSGQPAFNGTPQSPPVGNDPFRNMPNYGERNPQGNASAPPQQFNQNQEDPSKAAARMGMGFGPGGMFPMFQGSSTSTMPGTNSMINGAAVPAPQRYLPGQPQTLNLENQMGAPSTNFGQLQNQLGHQVPTATPHLSQPRQIGTPSQFNQGTTESYGAGNFGGLQEYDQQRAQMGASLDAANQANRSQQIQYAPVGNEGGVGFAAGEVTYGSQDGGAYGSQYTLPSNGNMRTGGAQQPPQYPYVQRPQQQPEFSPQPPAPGNYSGQQPASYPGRNSGGFNNSNSAGDDYPASGLPTITPGN
ncbi:MAG: tetratricopeptide repeat protein [Planctomycetaceae bacterium]